MAEVEEHLLCNHELKSQTYQEGKRKYCLFYFFLRQELVILLRLVSDSWACDPPTSVSQVLGLGKYQLTQLRILNFVKHFFE
jgi:hypothetical protein